MDTLLDEAPCGFLLFSEDGTITAANRTLAGWLGCTVTELEGKKVESLMSPAGRIFYQTHFFPLLSLHGSVEEIFMNLVAKDRSQLPVLVNARRSGEGSHTAYHCVLMPVRQRQKFEGELVQARKTAQNALAQNEQLITATRELEESRKDLDRRLTRLAVMNKDLAQFNKVISHDMREPVRKMAIFTDMILREAQASDSVRLRNAAGTVHASSVRMQRLIERLEEFVSVDTDTETMQPCELGVLIEQARQQALGQPDAGDIVITAGRLPVVPGRGKQLQLLFYHLILNAVQARKPDTAETRIRITADVVQQNNYRSTQSRYDYASFVRIGFSDEGQGFSPEYNEYVFQLFKKLNQDDTGFGFGLALCRKIADSHHGTISAESEQGKGATFTLLLPMEGLGNFSSSIQQV